MTYPHITSKLERKILAGALNTFRQIPKQNTNTKWTIFLSNIEPGVMDECVIDTKTWRLSHVNYRVEKGNKTVIKTISLCQ